LWKREQRFLKQLEGRIENQVKNPWLLGDFEPAFAVAPRLLNVGQ